MPGADALQHLMLCSQVCTLGIDHVDDGCADVEFDLQCSGVLTLYENRSFMQ